MKTGVIDVGGGLRGIYGAGVFDTLLEEQVPFDLCIGVSAGSANTASFLAKQKGRNYRFYIDYANRKEYMGVRNLFKNGSYLNLPYIYGTLSNADGEDPLDFETIQKNPCDWLIVSSLAHSGETYYFQKEEMQQNNYLPLMASSCLPGIDKPILRDGTAFFDGGLSDPMPIEKAISMGCDKIVVVLTKPIGELAPAKSDILLAKLIQKKYPKTANNLLQRFSFYNHSLHLAEKLQTEGKALILAPKEIAGLKTLTKDARALHMLYEMGLEDGKTVKAFLSESSAC